MLKRHEIEILLKVGHSKAEVARLAGVSLCSVKRIAEEVPVVHVDDAAEREKRRIGRPSIVEDFRKSVVKILEEKPDLPSLEILRRAREAGYQGGKTALYALVASVRPKEIKPLIRFEGLPGEFSQHDFGEVAHRAAMVAAVSGKRGKRYLKRQQLLELGEPAFLYLTEIVHRRPRQWFYDIDRLHDILQSHGAEVLRRAMEQGLEEQVFGATYIEHFLQRSLVFQEEIP